MSKQSDSRDLVSSMGWVPLPYDTVGIARSRQVSDTRTIWSWLILVPWAVNDSKPWIDGVEIIDNPLMKEADQRARVDEVMRNILDERYGEAVGSQAVDEFLKRLQSDD